MMKYAMNEWSLIEINIIKSVGTLPLGAHGNLNFDYNMSNDQWSN